MNSGFNLRTALHVAKRELITGHQYIVVGDGGTTICQSRSGGILVVDINSITNSKIDISANTYTNGPYSNGSLVSLNLDSVESNYYVPSEINAKDIPETDFLDFLKLELLPLFVDGELVWSDEFGDN
jgi:hypothetical protein